MSPRFENYFDILLHHRLLRGEKTALKYEGTEVSYSLLDDNINRFGNVLKRLGVGPGERLTIALPDCPDTCYAFFGSMKCGVCPVIVSPDSSREDYEFIIEDSQSTALVTTASSNCAGVRIPLLKCALCVEDEDYRAMCAKASVKLDPGNSPAEDITFLVYTTDSEGKLRGVPHSQADMLCSAENYAGLVLNMSENDVVFSASKLSGSYGMGNSLFFPLYFGATVVLLAQKSLPTEVFRIVTESGPTIFFAVPTLYSMMLKTMNEDVRFDSIRFCVSAGDALPAAIYHEWKKRTGLEIVEGIGSTETLHIVISNRPGDVHPGSSGFVVPSYETRIVDENGLPAASGRSGLLLIRGGSIAPCYWNRPYMTAKTMLAEGWLKTGDIYIEEDGCYTYLGRTDQMFKSGGNWVSPAKVEEVLRGHPSVKECAVGRRKFENLMKPVAYVVVNPGAEVTQLARDLRSYVLRRLPKYMCPVLFDFCVDLPKITGRS
jgi:benzoate-CoA ligase